MRRVTESISAIEECVRNGRIIILPYGRTDRIYHVFRRKTKLGKTVWTYKEISYETLAFNIARSGDDGLYFNTIEKAKNAIRSLIPVYGGSSVAIQEYE